MADMQRTPVELKNPDFNYFIAFKINPAETDKAKIEPIIRKALSNTSGSVQLRRFIELKTDILEIMVNDSVFENGRYTPNKGGRKKEADAAKKFKLDDAASMVEMLAQTRKTLLKSEIMDIAARANLSATYFTEAEFTARLSYLTKLGVKIIDNTDSQIPFSEFQKVEKQLEPIGKADLYDFLGIAKTASTGEVTAAIDKTYGESQRFTELKKKQSYSGLCGSAKKLLVDDAKKRKAYDQYIVIKESVWDELAKRKEYGIKEIKVEEYLAYTQTIVSSLKVSIDEAEKILAIGCKYFLLTVSGMAENGGNFEKCPFDDCGKLNVKGAKSCAHCGRSLEVLCWNCRTQMRITAGDKGCPSCGATNHAHELFTQKCQKLDRLLSQPAVEISTLQTAFLEVKNVVPNFASKPDSTVAKKVKDFSKQIDDRVKQEETLGQKYRDEVSKIRQMMAKRCYQAAIGLVKALPVKFGTYNADSTRKLTDDINKVMQQATALVNQAKGYISSGNVQLAITTAVKALEMCDDLMDARQILQKYPPKPPANLRMSIIKNAVRLEWDDPGKQDLIAYTIIKKIGVAPASPDDGAVVDSNVSVRFFEDKSIVPATPYYYAVFAERYGVRSTLAVAMGSAVIYSDVSNMRQKVVDGGVTVTWEAPQNIKSIEVWRNSGTVAPLKAGEGTRVDCTNGGFTDAKCTGESAYLVLCNYEVKGKKVQSKGVRAVYKPYEQIAPLSGVSVTSAGGVFTFKCDGGYSGKVKLFYAPNKLPIPTMSRQKYLDFNVICKGLTQIPANETSSGEITFALPEGKIYQLYPIVCTEQLFIASDPILINTVPAMQGFSFKQSNGTVIITGRPVVTPRKMLVRVCNTGYVTDPNDSRGQLFTFDGKGFASSGTMEFKLIANTVNYITVFAEFFNDGVASYSPCIKLDPPIDYREAVSVLYSLDYTVSSMKPFKVTIAFEADSEITLPDMLLMMGNPPPLNKSQGSLCTRIENVTLKKGLFGKKYTAKFTYTAKPTNKNNKFKLFINEESSRVKLKQVNKL